eukprot:COSAG01_NODE_15362_length_1346_cov_2.504411_1_plen_42_part_00
MWYQIGEPVAGNYYPVNSLTSLDDGKIEMVSYQGLVGADTE